MIVPCCCPRDYGKGYKIAHAKKTWLGMFGFDDCDGIAQEYQCHAEAPNHALYVPLRLEAPTVKFLSERRELTMAYNFTRHDTNPEVSDVSQQISVHLVIGAAQDRYTGTLRRTACVAEVTITNNGEVLPADDPTVLAERTKWRNVLVNVGSSCGREGHVTGNFLPPWTDDPCATFLSWMGDGCEVILAEIENDRITVALEVDFTEVTPYNNLGVDYVATIHTDIAFNLSVALSDEYLSTDCVQDATNLLAVVNLGDDAAWPWRYDNDCKNGPLIYYNELTTPARAVIEAWDGTCDGPEEVEYNPDHDGSIQTGTFTSDTSGASFDYRLPGPFSAYDGWTVYLTKWAETKVDLPAHNWARPCGDADRAIPDCDSGYPPTAAKYPNAPDCEGRDCNSIATTGDFTVREWTYNHRDWQVIDQWNYYVPGANASPYECGLELIAPLRVNQIAFLSRSYTGIFCEQKRRPFGTVLCISPNGESFHQPVEFIAWTCTALPDDRFGAEWHKKVYQYMYDPLFQPPCDDPETPENESNVGPGEANAEESRCTVPDGCPPLPAGIFVGCATIEDLNTVGTVDGNVCVPGELPCPPIWLYEPPPPPDPDP